MATTFLACLLAFGLEDPTRGSQSQAGSLQAIQLRFVRPERQFSRLLSFFEGEGAGDPAQLLASWRRAVRNPDVLGKVEQALLASLNPQMVREWQLLDGAGLSVLFSETGALRWYLAIPTDDGTLGALATALALTDGQAEPPLAGLGASVDRLGHANAPLLAQDGGKVVVGATRDDLLAGIAFLADKQALLPPTEVETGVVIKLSSKGLRFDTSDPWHSIARLMHVFRVDDLTAVVSLHDEGFNCESRTPSDAPERPMNERFDRAWLNGIPADASIAFAFALDREGRTVNAGFEAIDALLPKRQEPGARPSATLRTQFNLLANARGVFPELQLWPRIRGISGYVWVDEGSPTSALLSLHAADSASAKAIALRVLPNLARPFLNAIEPKNGVKEAEPQMITLGEFQGGRVSIATREETVLISWGDRTFELSPRKHEEAAGLQLQGLSESFNANGTHHLVVIWPDRLPLSSVGVGVGTPLKRALVGGPPIVLVGRFEKGELRHCVDWRGARRFVRELKAILPQSPAAQP